MWIRCRNTKSGHEASIPTGLLDSGAMSDWKPIKGAEPSAMPGGPTCNTPPKQPAKKPGKTPKE